MISKEQKITLLYDGECPVCHRYKEFVAARQKYNLQLCDAREHPELIRELREQGYDINAGMILLVDERIYHKDAVLVIVASMLEGNGFSDYLLGKIMKSPGLMKLSYPLLFGIRWLLLKWQGKETEI